jgi:hypothetical protein
MQEVEFDSNFNSALLPKIGAIVTTGTDVNRVTTPLIKNEGSSKMVSWGDNNDFPQMVIKDVRKDPELPTLLNKMAQLIYSGGLIWGKIEQGNNGLETLVPLEPAADLKIRDFVRKSNVARYLREGAIDLAWFRNVFPEIVLNVGRTEIIQICTQAAEECRWSIQNANGLADTLFVNANFPDDDENNTRTKKIPVLDPYYDPVANLKADTAGFNYIYPLSFPSPGSKHYQLADWNSIREAGWLAVSQAIPKFKKSLLEKQLNIKYHIEISDQFWVLKFPNWQAMSDEDKKRTKATELENFQSMMAGAEKSGNSLVTPFKSDLVNGKDFSLWKITAIDDKIKSGQFLEEGKDASLYKAAAVGLHPALVGTTPNSGLGGAGSNIREAYNLNTILMRTYQDLLLEPLNNLIKGFNNWDPNVEFRIRNSFMNTLDKGAETTNTAP